MKNLDFYSKKFKKNNIGDVQEISKLLATVLDSKDPYTANHSKIVRTISVYIGKKLKFNNNMLVKLNIGGYMHDIGKINVPDSILFKPERLNVAEFEQIKTHTTFGADFINKFDILFPYKNIILDHHEKYEGGGYPHGLSYEKISLEARLISIADVYHALYSKRTYKEPFKKEEIIKEFKKCRSKQFDPYLTDEMLSLLHTNELDLLINKQNFFEEFELEVHKQLMEQTVTNLDNKEYEFEVKKMVDILITALDIMNPPYADHCKNVKKTVTMIVNKLDMDNKTRDNIILASSLHDIGRLGQRTGLTQVGDKDDHFQLGENMLSTVSYFEDILPMVRHHHELYDGSGFPDKLKGEEIPLGSRVIAIADNYDALCKRLDPDLGRKLTPTETKVKMKSLTGKFFDPYLLDILIKNLS